MCRPRNTYQMNTDANTSTLAPDAPERMYKEIHSARGKVDVIPDLPTTCPVCGAPKTGDKWAGAPYQEFYYACGGFYMTKRQIQTHTTKHWGMCKGTVIPYKNASE